MLYQQKVSLIKKEKLTKDIFKFSIKSEEISQKAMAGNFLEIRVSENEAPFLRRPISIFNIIKEENVVEFIFQVKGRGTEILSKKELGDEIDVLGPLGKGTFDIGEYKNIAIIGGGIGIYPLYEIAKNSKGNVNTYLGFRNKEFVTCEKEFENVSDKLVITTDDGSYKKKGFAIDYLKEDCKKDKPEIIYVCGPLPMLRAVREFAIENNIPCQISLEERMGCGVGACLGCAVKVNEDEKLEYKHVCKDGPVFWANEVEF